MTYVPSSGPRKARFAIIGEAPGAEERRQGRPFVGPSGQLLREALERVGLDPEEAYITNVYKEYRYGNPTPTKSEVAAARDALRQELLGLPDLEGVLLLGNVPLLAVTGLTGITKHRGRQDSDWTAAPVYATVHPAAILRNSRNKSDWLNDLSSFATLIHPVEEDITVQLIDSDTSFRAMMDAWEAKTQPGALDIETTIGDLFNGGQEIISVAVSFDGKQAWVLTPDSPGWGIAMNYFKEDTWIAHNGSFDMLVLRWLWGGPWKLAHDTMAMAYLLHPEERKGLQLLSGVYLGLAPYKDVDYKNIKEEPIEKIAEMNGRDAARTWRLFRPLADELNQHPHLSRTYQWLLLPAIDRLIEMTISGVPLDLQRLAVLEDELVVERDRQRAILKAMVGEPGPAYGKPSWPKGGFNPGSPQQVAHVIFDLLGYPVLETTDKGAPSTGKAVVEKLLDGKGSHEFLFALMGWRRVNKRITASINPWKNLVDPNGYLHPKYKPTSVVTGRLAAELPNIQQVPREEAFRRVFGGHRGMTWVKADLSQIELRVAAFLADEPTMLQAYQDGEDLHAITARLVFGVEDVTQEFKPGKSARDAGKMLNFSLLYGAYPTKLIEIARSQYGVTLTKAEAEKYRAVFFDSYPRLAQWHSEVKAGLRATGKVSSLLGRTRTFPEINDPDEWVVKAAEREGINHGVQSFANDLVLSALVRLPQAVADYAIADVHDELDFFVPDQEVEAVVPIIKATMEDVAWLEKWGIEFTVPVLAEVTTKEYWA